MFETIDFLAWHKKTNKKILSKNRNNFNNFVPINVHLFDMITFIKLKEKTWLRLN